MEKEIEKSRAGLTLWEHQERAITNALNGGRGHYAIFHEMGLGKTVSVGHIIRALVLQHKRYLKTLIITPTSVMEGFYRELEKVSPKLHRKAVVVRGAAGKRVKTLQSENLCVYILNPEALVIPSVFRELLNKKFDILVVDECQRFKNPTAKRTKYIHRLADTIQYRYIMTGSPVLNSALDIWGQLRILSVDYVEKSFYLWRLKNFYDANKNKTWKKYPDWQPLPETEKKLSKLLHQVGDFAKKKDVLDLPPLVVTPRYLDMSTEVARHYGEMFRSFMTTLGDSICVTDLVITKLLRCRQILNGILPTEAGIKRIPSEKSFVTRELLEEICVENKHQCVIWADFRDCIADLRYICDSLGLSYGEVVGGQKPKERQDAIDGFAEGRFRVMLGNPQAGGLGIGLQAASYMIYYSKGYNLEHNIQSEARAHRAGSERHKKITRIDLITRGTIEEEIQDALDKKLTMQELLINIKRTNHGNRNRK